MKLRFKKAFSLIELLITLIILSLVLSAFIPLLTKKLKANDITVGSFGNNSIEKNVTKEDCDKFDALYIPAEMNDGIKPVCVTKYNMGDNGLPLADDVRILDVGGTCTDSGNCCWRGKTAAECSDTGNGDSTYSGCNRTVCQFTASYKSCFQYAPKGTKAGMWRLPKTVEYKGWNRNINLINANKGRNGLQLCDEYEGYGSVYCKRGINLCKGTNTNIEGHKNVCFPYHLATNNGYNHLYLWQGVLLDTFNSSNSYEASITEHEYPNSTRCVLDSMVEAKKLEKEDIEKDKHLEGEPQSQKDCDKLAPNLMFIDKAYNGTLGKNTCVTKYNIGDSGGPHLANIVDKTDVNHYCDGGYCCWVGKTSAECSNTGNGNSTYSGCNRTVCQWKAANATCALWAPDGRQGYWRLPSKTELDGWAGNLNKITLNMGKDGLQLCDAMTSDAGSVRCWYIDDGCPGTLPNDCNPTHIWSNTEESTDVYHDRYIHTGVFHTNTYSYAHAFSSRCVYDGDYHYQNIQKETSGKAAYRQPYSQKDCDPYNAMFIPAKYNGTGGKNLCVTKYNAFDTGGPEISYSSDTYLNGVAEINKKESCLKPHCCWKGETASSHSAWSYPNASTKYGKSKYLPNARTVCTYRAANNICNYWSKGGIGSGLWRLPTPEEAKGWAAIIKTETQANPIISKWMGTGGLQLCDETSDAHGSDMCTRSTVCEGATNNLCIPSYVWTKNEQSLSIDKGDAGVGAAHDLRYAVSVRCVTSSVPNN